MYPMRLTIQSNLVQKEVFQCIIKKEKGIKDYSKKFCSPKQSQKNVKTNGFRACSVVQCNPNDSLASIRYNMLCKKVERANILFMPDRG